MTKLYNDDSKSDLKFSKVECREYPKLCEKGKVNEQISVLFFGKPQEKFERMAKFFDSTVKKTLEKAKKEEEALVNIKNGNSLVLFMLQYCPRCKQIAPEWQKLADSEHKGLNVETIDCDKYAAVCESYGIEEYPTVLFMENGKSLKRYDGNFKKKSLEDFAAKQSHKV